jgi:hypothetical protein
MLCQFNDAVKHIELLVVELGELPVQKDEVLIRGIFYIVTKRTFDFNDSEPVCRLSCEVRV